MQSSENSGSPIPLSENSRGLGIFEKFHFPDPGGNFSISQDLGILQVSISTIYVRSTQVKLPGHYNSALTLHYSTSLDQIHFESF